MTGIPSKPVCAALAVTMLLVAGCAGGNAIDRAVPEAAFAESSTPLPSPVEPGSEPVGTNTADPNENAALQTVAEETQSVLPPEQEYDPVFSGTGQVANTGEYPNLGLEPRGATTQMSDAQRNALLQQMRTLSISQQKGRISPAQYRRKVAELRRLAATHSSSTIRKIEEEAEPQ
jgi:hypothetical protein